MGVRCPPWTVGIDRRARIDGLPRSSVHGTALGPQPKRLARRKQDWTKWRDSGGLDMADAVADIVTVWTHAGIAGSATGGEVRSGAL